MMIKMKAIVNNGRNAIPCQYPVPWPSSSIKCGSLGTNEVRLNRPFPSSLGSLHENEAKCSNFYTEMIFNSHANKTNFYKKGGALGLVLKMRQCFRNPEVAYSTKLLKKSKTLLIRFTNI